MRIAIVLGTRPEAIKLAPVVLALQEDPAVTCRVCVTGQHQHMVSPILEVFGITPQANLGVMQPGQTLAALTSRLLEALDGWLERERPELVLVQGDTTTVLCGTLASFYRRVPVGHVEAGLRTGNLAAPWPEEANRVLASRLATLHFAPTESARQNLLREGVRPDRVWVTGNTVIDALKFAVSKTRRDPPAIPGLPDLLPPVPQPQPPLPLTSAPPGLRRPQRPLVLITGHRRENFGAGFEAICRAIAELARRFPDTAFVYPVHLNPNVREPVFRILAGADETRNIHLIEPLNYLPFVALMDAATVILTDSGGVQEEAPSLGKPVVVMRETTERPEALATGLVELVGTDAPRIVAAVARHLGRSVDPSAPTAETLHPSPFGDGQAAERIRRLCQDFLRERREDPGR